MEESWTSYVFKTAPKGVLCQFMRPGSAPWISVGDFDPMFDISDLYWRLTGIGRAQLDAMNKQQRYMGQMYQNALTGKGLANGWFFGERNNTR